MHQLLLTFAILFGWQTEITNQENDSIFLNPTVTQQASQPVARDGFHEGLLKAIRAKRQKGELTRRQALTLRVRLLSPAFRQHCKDLAVTQMYFSGDEGVPLTTDGRVDVAQINWENLIDFLERLIPIILQLIEIFSANASSIDAHWYSITYGHV